MPIKTKTIEVEVQCCDECGDELYHLDEKGNPSHHVVGIYYGPDDGVYCERTCMPKDL